MTGNIDWQRYDENDEATHPRPCQELLIMALKNGKPVFIPHAYFGLATTTSTKPKPSGATPSPSASRTRLPAMTTLHGLTSTCRRGGTQRRRTRDDRNRNRCSRHPPRAPMVFPRSVGRQPPRPRKATHRQQGHGQHRRRSKEVHDSAFRREAECKPCRTRAREVLCIHAHARTARLGSGTMKAIQNHALGTRRGLFLSDHTCQ